MLEALGDLLTCTSKREKLRDTNGWFNFSGETQPGEDALAPAKAGEEADSYAHLLPSEPLAGQDKWLGGVLGADGCVYGVPGHARHVLQIDPANDAVRLIGDPLVGKFKWLRGNAHPDGSIYCIPCHAETVLKIDCTTAPPTLSEIGGPLPGEWKWHGGVLSPHDGCIYGIPQFAETVLRIDPATQSTSEIGGPFPGASPTGKHKWYGGLLGGDGCIYGIPQCATSVLKIDPFTQTVTTIGKLAGGGWKWHGGVVGRDGCIYGIPSNADTVLKIDPFQQVVSEIPFTYRCHHRTDNKYKYLGGVLGPDGRIYAIPSDADFVLRIDPARGVAEEIGTDLTGRVSHNCNKWQNGFLAADGLIYAIPLKADKIMRVDPYSDVVDVVGGPFPGFEKWEGGVLSRSGAMYCMPLKCKHVLKINPKGDGVAVMPAEQEAMPTLAPGVAANTAANAAANTAAAVTAGVHPAGAAGVEASAADAKPKREKSLAQMRREKRNGAPKPKPPAGAKTLAQVDEDKRQRAAAKAAKVAAKNGVDAGGTNGGATKPNGAAQPAAPVATGDSAPVVSAALPPDALIAHISTSGELAQRVLAALQTDGYIVLKGVLNADECAAEIERMWDFVTTVSPGVTRGDPSSWYPAAAGGADPWPHSGWRSFNDMFQSHHAGWLFSGLREKLASRVFEPLYGTRELHSSKEGFTFHRPTDGGRHPGMAKTSFVCGTAQSDTCGEHFDQGARGVGLQYIQSATAFLDQTDEDACFQCWPGSHAHHRQLVDGTWRGRSDWVPLTDAELRTLREAGLEPRRVPVDKGSVILWRSDLVHCGAPPRGERPGFRAVAYVSMLPASRTPTEMRAQKVAAYRQCHTGDHMADREAWHSSKGAPDAQAVQPYFRNGPPSLTTRQAELYGLVSYVESEQDRLDVQVA